ncbi:MAG: hypothetical protein PVSMB7_25930 [Chloroflexota bacterium]
MIRHAALSLVPGGLVGFCLGLIGGGGSILTVPPLVYVIGESVTSAIGTSLAIVGPNALFGFLGFSAAGASGGSDSRRVYPSDWPAPLWGPGWAISSPASRSSSCLRF